MPPAIAAVAVPAAIKGAAELGGAYLQSRSANKATRATQQATREALAFEKEREAYNRAQAERAREDYRRQWDAWNRQRLGLLRRYGIPVSGGRVGEARALSLSSLTRPPAARPQPTLSSLSGRR